MEKIKHLSSIIEKNKILQDEYRKNIEREEKEKRELIENSEVLQELKDFLFQVSANYREDICNLFTNLVTEALCSIFEKEIKFLVSQYLQMS